MEKHEFYIARKSCGCVVAASVSRPEWKNETAKDVARWIKEGLRVENVSAEYVRLNFRRCQCNEQGNLFQGE